jgi:hypothetical protein
MRLALASLTLAVFALGRARAEEPPDLAAAGKALYESYDPGSGRTGGRGVACGTSGELLARPVDVKRWSGLGREQVVAAFELWVIDPETNEPLEFAQACGRTACEVALLERAGVRLRVVARGRVDAGCAALDLAPYRMRPRETLIGVRGTWMNHGFGDTTLTLLRVDGTTLRPVLATPVDRLSPGIQEKGVVTVIAHQDEPAGIRIRFEREDDDGKKLPQRIEAFRWDGSTYVPLVQRVAPE